MYYLFILLCMAIIMAMNVIFAKPAFDISSAYIAVAVILNVVAVIVADGLVAFVIRWLLPKNAFSKDKACFGAGEKGCKFFEKIGIKKWKDAVPELGFFTAFRKNKIYDPKNNEYVERYIVEANYGVAIHFWSMLFGFAIIFIYPLRYAICFGVPVAIVNVFYNLLSFAILRYNLPKLHRLYKINERRAMRTTTKQTETLCNESCDD